MIRKELTRLTERSEATRKGIARRLPVENKCTDCIHSIGDAVMDCEYACVGVEEIADEGRVVICCRDYKRVEEW